VFKCNSEYNVNTLQIVLSRHSWTTILKDKADSLACDSSHTFMLPKCSQKECTFKKITLKQNNPAGHLIRKTYILRSTKQYFTIFLKIT